MLKQNRLKILVTGGAGFIGSNFIHSLLAHYPEHSIINLDKLTYAGNIDNIADLQDNKHHTFIMGDICDKSLVNAVIPGTDLIVHFAAETHVDRSIHEAGEFLQTDIIGTFILLEAAKKHKVKLFIQISTDEVYGSIEKGFCTENSPLMPSNPYSASKAAADRLAYSYYKTYQLPVIITRCSNNYGPYQHPEKLIPLFVTNAIEDKPLPLYGDGLNIRDWIYVEDHCTALELIINKGDVGEVYNIATHHFRTNIEVTKIILKYLHKHETLITYVKDRPGHDRKYSITNSKLKKLGWKPLTTFRNGVQKTVQWFIDHEAWWKKIKHQNAEFIKFHATHYQSLEKG
ncbi:MAG: dTDP-glucose 4,6-dehydratase [Candidatus Fischerbacteria bacterium RBG_13_37_8]|uniref:dTDP-glucose 4,6-dehydratase n=1 Tax=Candidatus Fischerbacteria bacterium RBG_13_37_8 TaxID=1817863 RepID=A0A1F5VGZ5_9BACT|nr:MAG: dTDP-glucose 4,6-dehydratase [Candidatus Fischerbacteria bacterium RBG_13_37_8]